MNYQRLINVSDNARTPPRKLEQLLIALLSSPKKQIELQRLIGLPTSVIRFIARELDDIVLKEGDRLYLREGAVQSVNEISFHRSATDAELAKNLELALSELKTLEQSRERSYRDFDQFRALPESTIDKVRFMYHKGDVEERSILLIGDNDLASVALGFTRLAKRITVLDIDRNLLNLIKNISQRNSFSIETINYNAKRKLPQELHSQYMVAITDPPYTAKGVSLFISRALSSIGRINGAVYLNYGYSSRAAEKALAIQESINKMGLVIEDVRPDFTKYYAAQSIGCTSSLYVYRVTPKSRPLFKEDFAGDIYTKIRQEK